MKRIWSIISYLGLDEKGTTFSNRDTILANQLNFVLIVILVFLNIITTIIRVINNGVYTLHTQKLLILLLFCLLNILFSYLKKHNITKFSLVYIPAFVAVFLPIFLGVVQDVDYVYGPLIIIGLSFAPPLLLKADLYNKSYVIGLIYFSIQVFFLDNILTYFSGKEIDFFKSVNEFHIYYKIVLVTMFAFIQTTMYYLRNLNYKFERELQTSNSELRRTIETLSVAQQNLVQGEKMASLGTLTAGIAHELNNPLNFIHGGISGIEKYLKNNSIDQTPKLVTLINAIKVGVKRAAGIVKSLDHYSTNENILANDCNLNSIVDDCIMVLMCNEKYEVKLTKEYTNTRYILKGMEGKLHQGILNVLLNSCQSIVENGMITITTKVEKSFIVLTIADNGCGISNENLSAIFDPFFTTKDPGKGTGLGLSITYKIIQEHNGTIEYKSELGKGTTATIKLPVKYNHERQNNHSIC